MGSSFSRRTYSEGIQTLLGIADLRFRPTSTLMTLYPELSRYLERTKREKYNWLLRSPALYKDRMELIADMIGETSKRDYYSASMSKE